MRLLAHAVRSVWNLCDDEPDYRYIHLHHSRKRIRGGVGHERPTVGGSLAAIMSAASARKANPARHQGYVPSSALAISKLGSVNGADVLSAVAPDRCKFYAFTGSGSTSACRSDDRRDVIRDQRRF